MPREKVQEQNRRRIPKACLYCQTSKQKCDGLRPCRQCVKRDQATACNYSPYERSYGRQRHRRKGPSLEAAAAQPNITLSQRGFTKPDIEPDLGVTRIAVPGAPHDIYDVKGRPSRCTNNPRESVGIHGLTNTSMFLVYLGNCAALSFLQNIRDMIQGEDDLAALTADVSSLSCLEELPANIGENESDFQDAEASDLESLVEVFFTSVFCSLPAPALKRY